MKLTELFEPSSVEMNITDFSGTWSAKMRTESGSLLKVEAHAEVYGKDRMWTLSFALSDSYDLTGDGNEFQIFKMVVAALKKFDEKHEPKYLQMTGDQETRITLYMKMLKRFKPSWQIESMETGGGEFTIVAMAPGKDYYIEEREGVSAEAYFDYRGMKHPRCRYGYEIDEYEDGIFVMPTQGLLDLRDDHADIPRHFQDAIDHTEKLVRGWAEELESSHDSEHTYQD